MDSALAEAFATEWIEAWNAHDLPRVLAHYADEFEMTSPMIATLAGEPSGRLHGMAAVGAYWHKALGLPPDLKFGLLMVLAGVDSLTLYYLGAGGRRVAEVLHLGRDRRITAAYARYA